jgi:hypothetical protein
MRIDLSGKTAIITGSTAGLPQASATTGAALRVDGGVVDTIA